MIWLFHAILFFSLSVLSTINYFKEDGSIYLMLAFFLFAGISYNRYIMKSKEEFEI